MRCSSGWPIPECIADPVVSVASRRRVVVNVYNAHGLLMHNMVAGNFDYVQRECRKRKNGRFRQIIHATRPGLSVAGRSWLANYG